MSNTRNGKGLKKEFDEEDATLNKVQSGMSRLKHDDRLKRVLALRAMESDNKKKKKKEPAQPKGSGSMAMKDEPVVGKPKIEHVPHRPAELPRRKPGKHDAEAVKAFMRGDYGLAKGYGAVDDPGFEDSRKREKRRLEIEAYDKKYKRK
jgi:hypothetical protein